MPLFSRYFIRLARSVRKNKLTSLGFIGLLVLVSLLGNAITFYTYDGAGNPDLTFEDSLWYSIISMTTIGYGDFSAQTTEARIGTVVFIVIIGLTAFTTLLGTVVDWLIDLNHKEKRGLVTMYCKDHVLIVNFPSIARVRSILEELACDPKHKNKDIVLVTDKLQELPFEFDHVSFVSGSPLQGETYERANAKEASTAVVLATQYDDPGSDSLVSSAVSVLEHINPNIRTIAECLDEKHDILFEATRCDSIIFPLRIANNLIVQETQDTGVSAFIDTLTSNRKGETVYSAVLLEGETLKGKSYVSLARKLLDEGVNLLSIVREGVNRTNFIELTTAKDDVLVYVAAERKQPGYFSNVVKTL